MAERGVIRMRLLRDSDAPPSSDGSACSFGIQNTKGELFAARRRGDGMFVFDFDLTVARAPGLDRPNFTGPFASGPRGERFVYLSWARPGGAGYVNRIKARLADIDWPLLEQGWKLGKRLEADMSGRAAGGGRVRVAWRLADD